MATSEKSEVEIELKCIAEKFWDSIKNTPKHFPKAFSDTFERIEVLEGDGLSVGSVFLVKHAGELDNPIIKERLEDLDEEKNMNISCNIFGGDLMKYYKSFKATIIGIPTEDEI
ncbi:hypothetical protein BUALT_Bualt17G0050300 [Buddleja alternifolia]|uniref:Bet v I/Major latex protein domain-containing protein n=1 Tax=Buddleja alternifolia TaxID=168488 RepID=A0AAV6WBR0_9LAMI|nr:hypothetical protein BUALT_Bualt17G0050300 [Buddleja alternifolia]